MTDKLIESYLRKQTSIGLIKEEDIGVFRYGYILMIEVLINFIISIVIGVLLGKVVIAMVFLVAFIPLRSFAGGYHANKAWKCILLSNAVIIAAIFMTQFMVSLDHTILFALTEITLGLVLIRMAPIQNIYKKLSATEMKFYKKIAIFIYIIEIMQELISFQFGYKDIACIILIAHLVVVLSLVVGKLQNRAA